YRLTPYNSFTGPFLNVVLHDIDCRVRSNLSAARDRCRASSRLDRFCNLLLGKSAHLPRARSACSTPTLVSMRTTPSSPLRTMTLPIAPLGVLTLQMLLGPTLIASSLKNLVWSIKFCGAEKGTLYFSGLGGGCCAFKLPAVSTFSMSGSF